MKYEQQQIYPLTMSEHLFWFSSILVFTSYYCVPMISVEFFRDSFIFNVSSHLLQYFSYPRQMKCPPKISGFEMDQCGFWKKIGKPIYHQGEFFNLRSFIHIFIVMSTSYYACHNTKQISWYYFNKYLKASTPTVQARSIIVESLKKGKWI